jgi:hypothetical protein
VNVARCLDERIDCTTSRLLARLFRRRRGELEASQTALAPSSILRVRNHSFVPTVSIGQVSETNVAVPLLPPQTRPIGRATETDTAHSFEAAALAFLVITLVTDHYPPIDAHDPVAVLTNGLLEFSVVLVALWIYLRRLRA